MAQNRDVKMTLSVDTLGEDGIKSLQQSILTLAAQGGSAAPEFQRLADEVGRLGEQSKALESFRALGDVTEKLAAEQVIAAADSAKLGAELEALRAKTDAAKVKQQEAADAFAKGNAATIEAAGALRVLKATYDEAGNRAKTFNTDQVALINTQTQAKVKLSELRIEQREANKELAAAEAEQKKAERAYNNSAKAVDAASKALKEQGIAVRESAAAVEKLGISTEDVAASEGQLLAALNKTGTEAQQHSAAIKEMAESDRLLAIQEKGLADLYARGAAALQAETLAQRDADRSNAQYAASMEQVNAEKAKLVSDAAKWQTEAEAIVNAAHAAQQMERDLIALVEAEQFLAAQNVFDKQAAEAAKLAKSAETLGFITAELNQIKAASDKAQAAFNTLNIRSAEAIKADILAVRSALETVRAQATTTGQSMAGAFTAGNAKIKELEREMRALNGTLTTGDKAAKLFSNSLGQISAGNLVADGVGYLINKVKEMSRAFLDAVVQGDQLRRGLTAIYKDTQTAASQIDFLRRTASESGVALGAVSAEFVRFSASMKSANIPLEQSNALFRAVTAASSSLGLSSETTSGALNALGQMASKGVVSMEELRQQLGDRLPGALGLTAKGFGITEAKLIELVSSGKLATRDFIGPFTSALETMRGEVDGLVPTWGRLQTAFQTAAQSMGEAGWVQILTIALKTLGGAVGAVVMTLQLVTEGLVFLAKAFVATTAFIMGDLKAFKFLAAEADAAANRINATNKALVDLVSPSDSAAAAANKTAAAMTANTAATTKAIAANTELSSVQKLVALSTALAADKTLDAGAKIVQYTVAANELIKKQEQQSEALGKLAKAAKEQGDTLVAMAELTGDVNVVQEASVKAAEMHAVALEELAKSQAAETAMLIAQKAEMIAVNEGRKGGLAEIKVMLDAQDALIKKSQAETEQSRQSSNAAKQQSLERNLLSLTIQDNSSKLDEYKLAMDLAALAVNRYAGYSNAGSVIEAQIQAKREALTLATHLYKDALNDAVTALQAKQVAEKADLDATNAKLSAEKLHYKALEDGAKAVGDYSLALYANIEQKKIDIAVINAKVIAMKAEAETTIAVSEAELKVLKASNEVNPVKQAQLEGAIKVAEAHKLEAAALGESTKGIEMQIAALRSGQQTLDGFSGSTNSAANASKGFAGALDGTTSALEQQNSELERNIAAQEKANDMKARAAALEEKKNNPNPIPSLNWVPNFQTEAEGKVWLESTKARMMQENVSGGAVLGNAGVWIEQTLMAQYNAQMKMVQDKAKTASIESQMASGTDYATAKNVAENQMAVGGGSTGSSGASTSTTTQTVNISIGGKSQSVNVASATDAANLTSILRSLESAANAST